MSCAGFVLFFAFVVQIFGFGTTPTIAASTVTITTTLVTTSVLLYIFAPLLSTEIWAKPEYVENRVQHVGNTSPLPGFRCALA